MSSEGSVSSSSRIRQFGLYRSIDARTEEFLRLSRKRQMRQGCVCAAVSTAITVTVVVVILLIYEYAIAVEWSLVQKIKGGNETYDITNNTHDTPFADRLDRSFFGFDQDYYERMPLLVNALQESNYVDPVIEMSRPLSGRPYSKNNTMPRTFSPNAYKQSKIRKISPRPFIFEYRSATPLPFSKTYGSRSWVDSYRNAQRLQNIRQVIRYLEKTINAKAGDMHNKPTNSHTSIAFSGVYVEPKIEKSKSDESNSMEQLQQNSNRVETYANHNEDPLFNFKPDSPGEVNLLADTFFRFSPVPTPSLLEDTEPKIPMFRRIPYRKNCSGNQCAEHSDNKKISKIKSSTERNADLLTSTKSFSVMLNLYPLKPNTSSGLKRHDERTTPSLEKIYITTSKPLIHFRRKPAPMRRTYHRYKRPRYLSRNKNISEAKLSGGRTEHTKDYYNSTTMILNVDVNIPEEKHPVRNQSTIHYTTSTIRPRSSLPITEKPVELFAGQVEDHHDGSSGLITIIIPEQTTAPTTQAPTFTQVNTVIPFFDTPTARTEINPWVTRATSLPDIIKFSAEDAKVPEHYLNTATTQAVPITIDSVNWQTTEMNKRGINLDLDGIDMSWGTTQSLPTGIEERNIFWETTEAPIVMDRRSMNLVTTQAVPMETIQVNMDWITTQTPIDVEENYVKSETTQGPNKMNRGNMKWATTQTPTEMDRYGQSIDMPINEGRERLIIKLRNGITTTERQIPTTTEEIEETTTLQTYVPQINGHYRNIVATRNQTRYSPETYRKRKLEMSVTGFRSYVPMYTEIKRNKTTTVEDSE